MAVVITGWFKGEASAAVMLRRSDGPVAPLATADPAASADAGSPPRMNAA